MKSLLAAVALVVVAAPASAAPADRRPPDVRITTPDGAVRLSDVRGTASDDRSGVAAVTVTYCTGWRRADGAWGCDGLRIETVTAALSCAGRGCTWTARVPVVPGRYLAVAGARDRAGNSGYAGPVLVVAV